MARDGWKWLEIAGNGWNDWYDWNGWNCVEISGICWIYQEMAGNAWNG